jgi:hypothetical protein
MGSPDRLDESTLAHRDHAIDERSVDDSWFEAAAVAPPTIDRAAARSQPLGSASLSVAAPGLARRASRRRPAGTRVTGAASRRLSGTRGLARGAALGAVALVVVVVALALVANPPRAPRARNPSLAAALAGGRSGDLRARPAAHAPHPDAAGLLLSPITTTPKAATKPSPAVSHHRHAPRVRAGAAARIAARTPAGPPALVAVSRPRAYSPPVAAAPMVRRPRPPRRPEQPPVTPGDLTPAEAIN